VGDDPRHAGEGLDVIDVGGLAPEAGDRRERRPLSRHPALAHDAGDEGRLLAAHEGAGALFDLELEGPAAAEHVLAEEAALLGGGDSEPPLPHGQRVLDARIDEPLVRADGVRGDQQPFDHGVRVAVHDRRVHDGPGVALDAVADDLLDVAGRQARELPFAAGRETCAAARPGARRRGWPQVLARSTIPGLRGVSVRDRNADSDQPRDRLARQ
jgi:hypothetical protein